MTYEETKELLDQYSVEDLRDLRKMIDESISTRSEKEYKKLVREFSDKYKVGDCFLRKYPENMLSIDFVANISEDKVRITRYHINFDDNDICIYDVYSKRDDIRFIKKYDFKGVYIIYNSLSLTWIIYSSYVSITFILRYYFYC